MGELIALFVAAATAMVIYVLAAARASPEETWCDGCKRFSPGPYCPHCPPRTMCNGCGHEIDLNTCGCGCPMEPHYDSTHSPVPMGCNCMRVPQPPSVSEG